MRISDWSSDVCSSDLLTDHPVCPLGVLFFGRPQLTLVDELDRLVAGGLGKAEQRRAPATYRLLPRPKTALAGKAVEMLAVDMGIGVQGPALETHCWRTAPRIGRSKLPLIRDTHN